MSIYIGVPHYGNDEVLDDLRNSLGVKDKSLNKLINVNDDFKLYILKDEEGEGFTKTCNKLISKFISNDDCEWVWLLNNDTEVDPNTLRVMKQVLDKLDDCIGIVGFQIRLCDNRDVIHHGGTLQCYPNGIHKSGSVRLNDLNKRTYERWVTFASVLIKADVIRDIGLLDHNMKMIYSDSDYCFRARSFGHKVIYEPKFVVYHKVGISAKQPSGKMAIVFLQDLLYFQNKWLNGKLFFDLDHEIFKE